MGTPLKTLTLRGFKSIKALEDFELKKLNVLIGANGAGKSNLVDFFRMLRAMADEALQKFVNQQGGGDSLFYLGPKATPEIGAMMTFGQNQYQFSLAPTTGSGVLIGNEQVKFTGGSGMGSWDIIGASNSESVLKKRKDRPAKWGGGTLCRVLRI
jgi:predicted ATPase